MRVPVSCVVAVCVLSGTAGAQTAPPLPSAAVPPLNIMLPNYNGVPAGEIGSLEGGAYVARANDASAAFYNPAGLALAERNSISGGAGVFQVDSVTPERFSRTGGSVQQIPAMVGVVIKDLFYSPQWAGGLSIVRVNAWDQSALGDLTLTPGGATDRVSYGAAAQFAGYLVNLGIGYTDTKKLRLGGSLDGQYTSAVKAESLGEQFRNSTGLRTLLVEGNGWGDRAHLRLSLGMQYDLTPAIHLGALMRTPGLGVYKGGEYRQEGVSHVGAVTTTASFFDDSPTFEYKLPFEFKAGAAYVGKRAQVEFDLLAHQGAGAYPAVQSGNPLIVITDQGLGGAPTVQNLPFIAPIVDSESVVNFVVGGRFDITSSGSWRVHGGFGTDYSPVGPNDTTFTKIDLQNWTVGVSGRFKFVLASLGVRVASGESDPVVLRTLQDGQQLQTAFKVLNLGFVYSLTVLF